MTPTGSWPRIRPGRTGYSPLTMWTSVPQIVVRVTRIRASPGPGRGRSTSSTWNSCGRVEDVGPHRVDRDHVGSPFVPVGRARSRRARDTGRRLIPAARMATPADARQRRRSPVRGLERPPARSDGGEASFPVPGFSAGESSVRGSLRAHGRRFRQLGCSRPGVSHEWSARGGARPPSGPASAGGRECPRGLTTQSDQAPYQRVSGPTPL